MGARADHPFTSGFLCVKTQYYQERLYSPLRVLYPQRRVGPKGSGQFERISWDEAIATIAERFREIIATHGAEAILPYSYAGTMGALGYASMDRRFFHYLGASLLDRTICSTTGAEAYRLTMGVGQGTDPEGVPQARLIVCWGANPVSTNVHLMPFIHEARRNGAQADGGGPAPQQDRRAGRPAHPHPPRHRRRAGAGDAPCHGRARTCTTRPSSPRTPSASRRWPPAPPSGRRSAPRRSPACRAEKIAAFARLYATTQPSVIRLSYGMSRHTNGGQNMRAVLMLPAVTGAWGVLGGGALLSTSGTSASTAPRWNGPTCWPATPHARARST